MTRPQAWISWSSGKDSTLALAEARAAGEVEVTGLLTTVNSSAGRVAMHAVRQVLLQAQATALGLPLHVVELPWPCPNEVYEQRMSAAVETARQQGVDRMVFGDLFLEDIRAYREQRLQASGRDGIFPLWGLDTSMLAREFVAAGFEAYIVCLDPNRLSASFAGRRYDEDLLCELPSEVDPCGENGEFHTFVHAGPIFSEPIDCRRGEIVEREGFVFCDLVPI